MSERKDIGDNKKTITDRIEEYLTILMDLRTHITDIEDTINRVGHLLDHSQPNNAPGKIGIRWWKTDRTAMRIPTLIHWEFTRAGKGAMKPVPFKRPPRKIKAEGVWSINAVETQLLIELFYALKTEWDKSCERLNRLIDKRRSRHIDKDKINQLCEQSNKQLDYLRTQIRDNLQRNGYYGDL